MNRRFNFGGVALVLTAVILGIFAVDFFRRLWIDWGNARGKMHIVSASSSISDIEPGTSEPDVTGTSDTTTQTSTTPASYTGQTGLITTQTTTTTVETADISNAQSITVSNSDVHNGSLLLINKQHPLVGTPAMTAFTNIKYDHIRLPHKGLLVNNLAISDMVKMFNAFYTNSGQGNIMVYATTLVPQAPAYQVDIPERASGLSLDLAILDEAAGKHTPYVDNGAYAWLPKHCAEYGYIWRYTADKSAVTGMKELKWHFRYVGIPHARYMASEELCLEEYINLVHEHTWETKHLKFTFDNTAYEVYYVPASTSGANTTIYYPAGTEVRVDGDNIEGFVVTCSKPVS